MSRPAASMQLNLSLWLSAAVLLAAAAAGILSFISMYREANDLQDQMLQQTAALINPAALPPRADNTDSDVRIHIQQLESSAPQHYALPARLSDGLHTISHDGDRYRVYVKTYPQGQRLAFIQETEFRDEAAYNSAWHAVAPLLLLLPVLTLLSIFTIRHMLRPMRQLSETLEHRPSSDLTPLPEARLPREVYGFVTAINRLLGRINEHMQQQQRFIADAAHELRSPLTALSLQAERLAQTDMPAAAAERLHILSQGILRSRKLLAQLLALAKVQNPSGQDKQTLSLHTLYRHTIQDLLPLAEAKNIDLGIDGSQDIVLHAHEADIQLLVNTLTDNAIQYTPPGGRIDLRAAQQAGSITIEIEDNGPGIPAAERERVFDPFYRILGNESEGTGLGLSIAKTMVESNNGHISLKDADTFEPGLKVEADFPAPPGNEKKKKKQPV